VAVGVAEVERHGMRAARDRKLHVVIAEEGDGRAAWIGEIRGLEIVQIEAVGAQLAFESDPSGGRMRVVEMRGFSVESFTAVLFFISALREADMGLSGEFAFFEGVHVFRIAGTKPARL